MAARVSLQRPFSEQILNPKQLFEFANNEITGATTYFVNSQSVKENISFLGSRFSNCSTLKRTCKSHEFILGGENIVINCVSSGPSKNLLIQQKEVVLSIEHIEPVMPWSLYACSYDDEQYFGVANYISIENYDANIKFLQSMALLPSSLGLVLGTLAGSQYIISLHK